MPADVTPLAGRLAEALRTAPGVPASVLEPQFRLAVQAWAKAEAKAMELSASAGATSGVARKCQASAVRQWSKLKLPADLRAGIVQAVTANRDT